MKDDKTIRTNDQDHEEETLLSNEEEHSDARAVESRKIRVSNSYKVRDRNSIIVEAQAQPIPRRSLSTIHKLSHGKERKSLTIEERLRRKSSAWIVRDAEADDEEKNENFEFDENTGDDLVDASVEVHPSILSRTYKDVTKHVLIQDELLGEDLSWTKGEYDGEDLSVEYSGESEPVRQIRGTYVSLPLDTRRGSSFVASVGAAQAMPKHEHVVEAYKKLEIRTFGQLLEAKSVRPKRLDAYCLGRGILEPKIPIVSPQILPRPKMKEEVIEDITTFFQRIQEIEEENVNNLQVVCVFTGNIVRTKKTWSEDCNLIETAVNVINSFLSLPGYLLWVRTGTHKEWKDPENPFRTDKRLMIKWLPTIKVWNTEKRVAGRRLFFLDYITVLLED